MLDVEKAKILHPIEVEEVYLETEPEKQPPPL
jgi:hypothetical protein